MHRSLLFVCTLCWLHAALAELVKEEDFSFVKNNAAQQVVVFYYRSDSSSKAVLDTVEKVAERLSGELPQITYRKCDGDLAVNKEEFAEAKFGPGTWVFTSTPVAGIEKYEGEVTVEQLAFHIRSKYFPFNEADTLSFADEDDFFDRMDQPRDGRRLPTFVMFSEPGNSNCERVIPAFQRAATFLKGQLHFVLVDCVNGREDSVSFCQRQQAQMFPKFVLFTGEDKFKFEGEDRSVLAWVQFFRKHIDITVDVGQPVGSGSSGEQKKKSKKGRKRQEKKQRQRQEEEEESRQRESGHADEGLGSFEPVADEVPADSGRPSGAAASSDELADLRESLEETKQLAAMLNKKLARLEARFAAVGGNRAKSAGNKPSKAEIRKMIRDEL